MEVDFYEIFIVYGRYAVNVALVPKANVFLLLFNLLG